MAKNLNKFITFILFVVVVGLLFSRQKTKFQPEPNPEVSPTVVVTISPSASPSAQLEKNSYEFVATMSGQSALELVQSQVELDLKEYDFGVMVEAVNGLKADSKHYWALYQAGDYALTGISQLKLTKNEKIELKYEEIKL